MHAISLKRLHVMEFVYAAEHHKIVTALILLGAIWIAFTLALQSGDRAAPVRSSVSVSAPHMAVAGIGSALTLLDAPHLGYESHIRADFLLRHIKALQEYTLADRAYLVAYNYDNTSSFGNDTDVNISHVFERCQGKAAPFISRFIGFPRTSWLQIRANEQFAALAFSPIVSRSYGREIEDRDGRAIGYVGIEYMNGAPPAQMNVQGFLKNTADSAKLALLQPVGTLNRVQME